MQTFEIRDEFIKLGQALKAAGFVESGVDAKFAVQDLSLIHIYLRRCKIDIRGKHRYVFKNLFLHTLFH